MRLVMKKLIFLMLCVVISIPGNAQRDIKTLDRIGRNAIIAILGQPDGKEYWGGIMDGYETIQYPDTYICLDESTSELVGFNSTSSSFCVLSDYFAGGIKVGDSFETISGYDFVHTKYGKDRTGNKLTLVDSSDERDYYEAFGEERKSFYFVVKKGTIIEIDFGCKDEEEAAYYMCDMSNSPW